jgi:hypothetical protein
MAELRYFNPAGREQWASWLNELKSEPTLQFPDGLLTNPDYTLRAPGGANIEPQFFETKFELATALAPAIAVVREARLSSDRWPGLWDWLSAFHFDSICPKDANGRRELKQQARYLLDVDYRRRYRHRIFGPVDLYSRLGPSCRLLIHGSPASLTDWEEQTASRYQISSNRGIAEALYRLYWDAEKEAPKRGAAPNARKPGTLRRFSDLMQQLDRTYDLLSVGTDAIMDLLPKEFAKFKTT